MTGWLRKEGRKGRKESYLGHWHKYCRVGSRLFLRECRRCRLERGRRGWRSRGRVGWGGGGGNEGCSREWGHRRCWGMQRHLLISVWKEVGTQRGFPGGSGGKESACNAEDPTSIPESGRSPGEGNGNPLQYSCLENSTDRGTWWASVHSVTKSRTWLKDYQFHSTLPGIQRAGPGSPSGVHRMPSEDPSLLANCLPPRHTTLSDGCAELPSSSFLPGWLSCQPPARPGSCCPGEWPHAVPPASWSRQPGGWCRTASRDWAGGSAGPRGQPPQTQTGWGPAPWRAGTGGRSPGPAAPPRPHPRCLVWAWWGRRGGSRVRGWNSWCSGVAKQIPPHQLPGDSIPGRRLRTAEKHRLVFKQCKEALLYLPKEEGQT